MNFNILQSLGTLEQNDPTYNIYITNKKYLATAPPPHIRFMLRPWRVYEVIYLTT